MKLHLSVFFCVAALFPVDALGAEDRNCHSPRGGSAPAGISLMQLLKRSARPEGSVNNTQSMTAEEFVHDTHVDPHDVGAAAIDKPGYDKDWTEEWHPNPNPPNRTTTHVPATSPRVERNGVSHGHSVGLMAVTALLLSTPL
mmetsp:Transcript_58667/g.136445  ORF Transcript_58667/g.136445 Transcript_58667/m.136445 type:complete len:142 (-) Transcript_58667:57-482(-)